MHTNDDVVKSLINPKSNNEPIVIEGFDKNELLNFLKSMIKIRLVETKLASGRKDGFIGGPVHLGVGQEAVAVGVSYSLTNSDKVFGAHRSHSHILALGTDVRKLFAEILGKNTGLSKGMGGSMHLVDESVGFYGSVPIVAGTIPLAVGAGMASRLQNTSNIAIAYLGDGACEEGVFHESLNLARIQKDPVIFVVENNMFASHMYWDQRQPSARMSRFAEANSIPYKIVDGNNVVSIANDSKMLIERARSGSGPALLEVFTYRWYGHVDWRDDIDVGVCRSLADVNDWKLKDPIKRLFLAMQKENIISTEMYEKIISDYQKEIDNAWKQAINDPYPEPDELKRRVYKNV